MNARIVVSILGALLFNYFGIARPGHAEEWHDPERPLTWDATLACELVVLAKYESHQAGELKLRVAEVLKGKLDAKKPLAVKLAHLYTVETGPVGWDRLDAAKKGESIPKVCYKQQFINPGGLEPYAVRADAREPAIYFFPRATEPVLKVRGQVQSPYFQKGWQQALDRKPMDLLFRLMQDVNSELAREAFEELGRTREPATLDQLFAWIVKSTKDAPTAEHRAPLLLARLGDRDGDIYDRARKSLLSAVVDKEDYRPIRLGWLLAIADPKRAAKDLPGMLSAEQPLIVRRAALRGLGRIPERQAAQLALDSLRDGDVAYSAVGSLRCQLDGDEGGQVPKYRGLNDEAWLVEQLQAALMDDHVTEKTRQHLREHCFDHLRPRAPVDLEVLRKILLDPKDPMYQEYGKGSPPPKPGDEKTANLLRDAREACDPRLVPLLAEVLEKMPAAGGSQGHAFQETLRHYARICPRAMKKELVNRGFPGKLRDDPSYGIPSQIRDTMEAAQIWPSRHKPYLEKEIAHCFELAAEVRAGKSDQTDALLKAVEELQAKHPQHLSVFRAALPALLDSGAPSAREKFFDYLKKARQGRINRWSNQITLDELSGVVSQLHPKHAKLHIELVLELLKSKSLAERAAGVGCLGSAWRSDFGFDHKALEADRTRQLAEIEPFLLRVSAASETQARVLLLARAGYVVDGEPNDSWLPTLQKAAATKGEAARHAMRLVEVVVGEPQCREFAYLPPPQRSRALRAYLADAGKLAEAPSK